MHSFTDLLAASGFLPHGQCYLWSPYLLWTMVTTDLLITAAYYSIPLSLVTFVMMRRDVPVNRIVLMFGAFIFACGTTHLMSVVTVWYPVYWAEAAVKSVTAAVSMATAVMLLPVVRRVAAHVDQLRLAESSLLGVNQQLQASLRTLEGQRADLEQLNRMSGLLQVCNSPQEAARVIADAVAAVSGAPDGAVYIASEDNVLLESAWTWGDVDARDMVLRGAACWAFRRGQAFPDGAASSLSCEALCRPGLEHLCLPLTGGGETLGVLQLRGPDLAERGASAGVLDVLVDRAGLGLANIRLRENLARQSTRDALTGLFNRGYLEETLTIEERRCRRTGGHFTIVMLDIDRFKLINDEHGHDAGDAALRSFAGILAPLVRGSDVACRYGGEEFALVLPGGSLEHGMETAERVRRAVEQHTDGIRFTVSAGVASFPRHGDSAARVRAAADRALYSAKNAGRNRVIAADG